MSEESRGSGGGDVAEDREERSEVDASAERHVAPKPERPSGALGTVRMFLDLVKFEHSIFALPYAYIGALYGAVIGGAPWHPWYATASAYVIAPTPWVVVQPSFGRSIILPTWSAILWVTVAMVGARSFAFVVNRAVDREIDARNPRTAVRAVPAGLVKAWELWLFAALVLAAFLFAVWQLHPATRVLWPIVLGVFVAYPYLKRFTWLCHYWLGLCLGLAPVGGWVAITGNLSSPPPWILGLAVLFWLAGFDIIYALMDVECDVRDGIHSVPADFGIPRALVQSHVCHALTVVLLALAGPFMSAGPWYYAGVAAGAVALLYENTIVKADDLTRVDFAFFTMNALTVALVFAGALADRLLA